MHVAQEPCAVSARRLDADAPELPEGSHPGEHLLVAVPGRRKTSAFQHPVELIDDGSDVKTGNSAFAPSTSANLIDFPPRAKKSSGLLQDVPLLAKGLVLPPMPPQLCREIALRCHWVDSAPIPAPADPADQRR